MSKVTIIIPAYNVEKYIAKSIESAVSQTLKDIEIICVNDGSTDQTLDIINDYASKDARIQVINKDNTGYGHTMNLGIDSANGKYIVFLESDDFILPDMCERMYQLCEQYELEMLKCDFYGFISKGDSIYRQYYRSSDYGNYGKVLSAAENPEIFFASMYTWTCMYRSDYLKKHNIRHNETPGASYQDNGFWFQSLMYCSRIYLLDEAFYMYRKDNPGSSTYNKEKVHAYSDEYAFIREIITDYDGDKKTLTNICAFFNLHQNLNSLWRVDRTHIMELLDLITSDFHYYLKNDNFDICRMDLVQSKKILQCIAQPRRVCENVIIAQEQYQNQVSFLQKYQSYILYGAGKYAEKIWRLLIDRYLVRDKKIYCGVTEPNENQYFNEIRVEQIETLCRENENALVIVCSAKKGKNREQMHELLKKIQCDRFVDTEYFFQQQDMFGFNIVQ